jgi:hypothetical protein
MDQRRIRGKGASYRKTRNIYIASAIVCYLGGGLLAVTSPSRGRLFAVGIPAGAITLVLMTLAILYGRAARAYRARERARSLREQDF